MEHLLDAGSYSISRLGKSSPRPFSLPPTSLPPQVESSSSTTNGKLSWLSFWRAGRKPTGVERALLCCGYGHIVPLSTWGKIFCILYSCVGIPLTLVLLACLLQYLLPILSHCPVHYIHTCWGFPLAHVALAHATGLELATLGLFMLIHAVCFWVLEHNWNFLESVYFCIISLSTIGLGNYLLWGSSQPPLHKLYELSITCYLLVGLLAMLVTVETAHQLWDIRALVHFFAPAHDPPPEDDDRLEILARDQLALITLSGSTSQDGPIEMGTT
ncbi:potassium channel subfamily K member 1-like [Rhineura floridana]|uniref:potassium channel subfamily K member 1-like n=1 Tax=Rhineura floridana TaxID=261503 RepID=UPI002AC88F12|nr:potassium channel subfamily K member 1-like [Rhineura floridana]XP_061450081.1 potassium channel subfamily K member 1-like [Rhineura floridana]XP_061450082.1 potassium channel subfamily K member 1-like [Rhineura floridana]